MFFVAKSVDLKKLGWSGGKVSNNVDLTREKKRKQRRGHGEKGPNFCTFIELLGNNYYFNLAMEKICAADAAL